MVIGMDGVVPCSSALAIFSLASIAPVFLDSPVQIIVARAVAGIGAALIMPATLSVLTTAFPKNERNKAVGIWAGAASSSAVVGFLGTGLLLHFFSWESIFYGFAASGIALFIATCTIRSSRDETATPLDWVGAVLIGAALAVFVFGVVEAPTRGWTHPIVWGCMVAGVVLGAAFAVVQLRRRYPLLDVRLFGRPDFATGAIGITFLFFANFGFFFVAMQYMQLILGYSPLTTRIRPHTAGGADHGSRRDDAPVPAESGPPGGGRARPVPDRSGPFRIALPQCGIGLRRPRCGQC